jgi:hypothetical protein
MKRNVFFGLLIAWMVLLTGCAFLTSAQRVIDQENFAAKTGVQYGTLKLISQSSDVTAEGVLSVAARLKGAVEDDPTVTLAMLAEEAGKHIPWDKFDLADRILIINLMDFIEAYLAELVGDGILEDDAKATVINLLRWIEEAAKLAEG